MSNGTLEFYTKDDDHKTPCDGCDREIARGEYYLSGINSCCNGGCYRDLCAKCVKWISNVMVAIERHK